MIYPKAWLGFDWNPLYVKQTKTGFIALNADSLPLWSQDFNCEMKLGSPWQVGDINNDGKNEIAFIPCTEAVSEINANLILYDYSGEQLFRQYCPILGEYPGDTSAELYYSTGLLKLVKSYDKNIIVTMMQ